jgi:hypothetical protein
MTLVELILVMALLTTVMAISAPRLARFYTGRSLVEESRRFLALTRYARSEAVARSVPMELWIDADLGAYGLRPKVDLGIAREEPIEYHLAENLYFEVAPEDLDEDGITGMLFWPDGTLDLSSVEDLYIAEDEYTKTLIQQADYGLGYRIRDTSHHD